MAATVVRLSHGVCSRSPADQSSARAPLQRSSVCIASQRLEKFNPLSEGVSCTSQGAFAPVERSPPSEVGAVAFHRICSQKNSRSLRSAKGVRRALKPLGASPVARGVARPEGVLRRQCPGRASASGRGFFDTREEVETKEGPDRESTNGEEAGSPIGKEADMVVKYREKVTRRFGNIYGDYYVAPSFMDKVVTHICKNLLAEPTSARVPLILGIWGGKGQGKSFQVELICRALGIEPVIMSAGELEGERAGEPSRLVCDRYRAAGQVVKVQGKLSCLIINDIDAGVGRFVNTQMTINSQLVMETLTNLADNPTRVSIGQDYREADVVPRVPIILTANNDMSTLSNPLIRDGRMDEFHWLPSHEDKVNIVTCMFHKDGLTKQDIEKLVDLFSNQPLDFFGAMRSRTYDNQVKKWLEGVGGTGNLRAVFPAMGEASPALDHQKQTLDNLITAGNELVREQDLVMGLRLSEEYMNSSDEEGEV